MLRIEPRLAFINGVLLANRVFIFRSNKSIFDPILGTWPEGWTFSTPRYVICIPCPSKTFHDVLVLDQHSLYHFNSSGSLKKQLLNSEGYKFRGLTFCEQTGLVATTQKSTEGDYLVLIDLVLACVFVK
jgi:hypothetical protein